jgi:hypothetical protein
VWVHFNERFAQYGSSTGHLEVSNNNFSTFTSVYAAETGLSQNQSTSNPHFVDVDLSAVAANQANVKIRFHWTGAWDYWWFIDDIVVYTRPTYDAAIAARVNANEYTVVPRLQYNNAAIPLSITAKNAGGSTISNVTMSVKVYDGNTLAVLSNPPSNTISTLAANATGTLSAVSFTPPAGNGFYLPEYIISMTQADSDHTNDTVAQGFMINDSLYARDDAVFTGRLNGSLGSNSSALILGQNYDVLTTDRLKRVRVYVDTSYAGDQTQIVVYNTTNELPVTQIASSAIFTFSNNAAQWVDLPLSGGPIQLTPGTYFIGIRQISPTHNLAVGYTNNNLTPYTVYAKIGTDPWDTLSQLGFNVAFLIRPVFICGSFKPTITPTNAFLCTGDAVTLTATTGTSYNWSLGSQATPSINITSGGTFTVTVTNALGCTATSAPLTIPEYPKPSIFLGNDTTVCGGITLNAGSGFSNYSWTGGSSTNQYLWAGNTGPYSCTVTNSNGCSKNDAINITVNPYPVVHLGHDTTLCAGASITLNAGGPYSSYNWSYGSGSSMTQVVDSNGIGLGSESIIVVVSNNNCIGRDTIVVNFTVCSGIENSNPNSDLIIYPNPASGIVYIEIPASENVISMSLMNAAGQLVMSEQLPASSSKQVHELNVATLGSGMYIMKLQNGSNVAFRKIMIK